MANVKIQYIVNGVEFTSEKEAKKYADRLTMNPKYNEGDRVFIIDSHGFPNEIEIVEPVKMFGSTHYKCIGYPKNVEESKIYPTVEAYIEYIKNNVKYMD